MRNRAFAIFCEDRRQPDVAPAVTLLRTKPLRPGALDVFARRDPLGTGFVCRVDLFDGLRELGISGTPPNQARRTVYFSSLVGSIFLLLLHSSLLDKPWSQVRSLPSAWVFVFVVHRGSVQQSLLRCVSSPFIAHRVQFSAFSHSGACLRFYCARGSKFNIFYCSSLCIEFCSTLPRTTALTIRYREQRNSPRAMVLTRKYRQLKLAKFY